MSKLLPRHSVNQVALAQCWPIESVTLVQYDFVSLRLAARSLTGAKKHFYKILSVCSRRMRDNDRGVRIRPTGRLPGPNVECIHSSGGRSFLYVASPKARSTFSHSGSSGRSSITGKKTFLKFFVSLATLTNQVSSSNCWIVTAELGGHSRGMTSLRRSSKVAVFICGNIPQTTRNYKESSFQLFYRVETALFTACCERAPRRKERIYFAQCLLYLLERLGFPTLLMPFCKLSRTRPSSVPTRNPSSSRFAGSDSTPRVRRIAPRLCKWLC
jgi:hypothetical protein